MNPQPDTQNPFILTLQLNEEAASFFNEQRQRHFPANVNFLQAHLTLFHYLPLKADEIITQIQPLATAISPFEMQVTDVVSLGKGVAYKIESKELQILHKQLQQLWTTLLKPQDLQKLWPHITIQNKVTPQQARELLAQLKATFQPFTVKAIGLSVWKYLNGPWKFIETISFSSNTHL
jgi:2'-5' RNA ligase